MFNYSLSSSEGCHRIQYQIGLACSKSDLDRFGCFSDSRLCSPLFLLQLANDNQLLISWTSWLTYFTTWLSQQFCGRTSEVTVPLRLQALAKFQTRPLAVNLMGPEDSELCTLGLCLTMSVCLYLYNDIASYIHIISISDMTKKCQSVSESTVMPFFPSNTNTLRLPIVFSWMTFNVLTALKQSLKPRFLSFICQSGPTDFTILWMKCFLGPSECVATFAAANATARCILMLEWTFYGLAELLSGSSENQPWHRTTEAHPLASSGTGFHLSRSVKKNSKKQTERTFHQNHQIS